MQARSATTSALSPTGHQQVHHQHQNHQPEHYQPQADDPFHLPTDIIWAVVDYLQDERNTLVSLTLVSWEWHHPSRFHLFHSIHLRASEYNCSAKLERFTKTFDEGLAKLVREFTLEWKSEHDIENRRIEYVRPDVQLTILFLALQRLPSLHTLSLRKWYIVSKSLQEGQSPPFSLRKLVLSDVNGPVSAFSALFGHILLQDALHLLNISILRDRDPPDLMDSQHSKRAIPQPHPSSKNIKRLSLAAVYLDRGSLAAVELGRSLISIGRLTSLDIGPHLGETVNGVVELIQSKGWSLTHLRLDMSDLDPVFFGLNLNEFCPSLRTLQFSIRPTFLVVPPYDHPAQERAVDCYHNVASILSKGPKSIRKVIIGIQSPPIVLHQTSLPHTLDSSDLAALDDALKRLRLLESVLFQEEALLSRLSLHVNARRARVTQDMREFLISMLPSTHSRGVLQFYW